MRLSKFIFVLSGVSDRLQIYLVQNSKDNLKKIKSVSAQAKHYHWGETSQSISDRIGGVQSIRYDYRNFLAYQRNQ